MDMKWYVVYTKPGSEKKVSDILTRKKFENYCPVNSRAKKSRDNRKVKETALFKGYVFVKTADLQHEELKKINGVVNLVYWLGKPVTVKNVEIKTIMLFLNEYANIIIEKTDIKNNDKISSIDGMLVEQEAPLITIKNKRAYVILPSLGYIMTAEVETPNVRVISSEGILETANSKPSKLFGKVSEINNSLKGYWAKALIISICVLALTR